MRAAPRRATRPPIRARGIAAGLLLTVPVAAVAESVPAGPPPAPGSLVFAAPSDALSNASARSAGAASRAERRTASAEAAAAALCEREIRRAALRHAVPERLLMAVALTESGRAVDGQRRPWPWTINGDGAGHWLPNRARGLALAESLTARGVRSYDVGCMQINRRWHGDAFASLEAMFDPAQNVDYAARFLKALAAETGSWLRAAGLYHSRTPELAQRYRGKVEAAYARLDGLQTAATPPPPEKGAEIPLGRSVEGDVALARRAHARFGLVGASAPLLRQAAPGGLFGRGPALRPLFDRPSGPLFGPSPSGGLLRNRPEPPAPPEAETPI